MKIERQRFTPSGALALAPNAFGKLYDVPPAQDGQALQGELTAVVSIHGPLMNHPTFCFDSYQEIRERVAVAIELGARVVVLSIDSPGGVVAGAFDTSRELRSMCEGAGVELRAHIGGVGASAAYALASAATHIGASRSAMVGSIGIIDTIVDASAQNEALGLSIELVASGARKTDSNPAAATTTDAIAAVQVRVDALAEMFFELVADHGWSNAPAIKSLEAGIMTGEQAATLGLVTVVATLAETVAFTLDASETTTDTEGSNMANPMEDAIASLRKAAEGDDEEEAKRAKAALAALEEDGDDEDAKKAKAEEEEDAKKAKAGEEEDAKKAKAGEEEDAKKAKAEEDGDEASATAMALKALAEVHEMKASIAAGKVAEERADLLDSRPDFAPEMLAILATASMATVRRTVKELPRGKNLRTPKRTALNMAADTNAAATRGVDNTGRSARLDPAAKAELDQLMGLTTLKTGIKHTETRMIFGANLPATVKGK